MKNTEITTCGWYWMNDKNYTQGDWTVVQIEVRAGDVYVYMGEESMHLNRLENARFSGPIYPPKDE